MPTGLMHFKVKSTQHHYSWNKPHTVIHNLIFGSLWADHVSVTMFSTKYRMMLISEIKQFSNGILCCGEVLAYVVIMCIWKL